MEEESQQDICSEYTLEKIFSRIIPLIPVDQQEELKAVIDSADPDKKLNCLQDYLKANKLNNNSTNVVLLQIQFELDMMNFDQKVAQLTDNQFQATVSNPKALKALIKDINMKSILRGILQITNERRRRFLQIVILQAPIDQDIGQAILFTSHDITERILQNNSNRVFGSEVIAQTVESNYRDVAEFLDESLAQKDPVFEAYLNVLGYFICDPQSEIGLPALQAFQKMATRSTHLPQFFQTEEFQKILGVGISLQSDTVVQLRFMQLIICLSTCNYQLHEILLKNQLLEKALNIYNTDDILAKLNSVEIISKIGEAEWSVKYLAEGPLFGQLVQDGFKSDDFYVQKFLVNLMGRFIAFQCVKPTDKHRALFLKFLETNLVENYSSEECMLAGMEVISNLGVSQWGLDLLFQNKNSIIRGFFDTFSKSKQIVQEQFINAFEMLMTEIKDEKQNQKNILQLFVCLGNPGFADDIDKVEPSINNIDRSMDQVYSQLMKFVPEIQYALSKMIQKIVQNRELLLTFIKHQNCLQYLLKSYAFNHDILVAKQEICIDILDFCEQNQEKITICQEFLQSYIETKDNLRKQRVVQFNIAEGTR